MALLVTRAHHDPAATLQVVGRSVVPSYTAALHRFVDDMGLHHAVVFRGALSDAALTTALAESDAFVLPSRHEGFGVTVLEAMRAGVPVVANKVGALPEVVGDGGLLVDADDPYALADAMARVVGQADLRAALAAAAGRRTTALSLDSAGDRAADLLLGLRSAA
jgi:glycosyltransferase involved in cell wall biosynthesis